MKVMLVCTAGMSTSLVMKKIETYAKEQAIDLTMKAYPLQEFHEYVQEFDMILLGPQISYKREEIQESLQQPVAVINGLDYALGNAKNIILMMNRLKEKGENL